MRPPVLPSGNTKHPRSQAITPIRRFNEAAGFTQRKLLGKAIVSGAVQPDASMRPPVLPSGNRVVDESARPPTTRTSFNEAAGFTQRKPSSAGCYRLTPARALQ